MLVEEFQYTGVSIHDTVKNTHLRGSLQSNARPHVEFDWVFWPEGQEEHDVYTTIIASPAQRGNERILTTITAALYASVLCHSYYTD